jgi:predicted SprT family Zn-dependent metalloprotease
MDLKDARTLIDREMQAHGLPALGWTFRWGYADRQFGVCRYRTKTISLSIGLTELNAESDVLDTVRHEIAHALVGSGHAHDKVWKAKAIEIGCNGKATYSSHAVVTPPAKLIGTCPNCGKTVKAQRRRRSACLSCCNEFNGGKFHEDFAFTWDENPARVAA